MKLLLFLMALCLGGSYAAANVPLVDEILTFEDVAPLGSGSAFIDDDYLYEGSYRIFVPHGQYVDDGTPGVGTDYPDNGSDWFLLNNTSGLEFSHPDRRAFFLSSFDATEYYRGHPGGSAIEVRGLGIDQTLLTHTFFTPARPQFQLPEFTRFTLPNEWQDFPLQYATITAPSRGFAIDNIQIPYDSQLEFTPNDDRIFWVGSGPRQIRSMPLPGGVQDYLGGASFQQSTIPDLEFDRLSDSLYYTETFTNDIRRIDAKGGELEIVFDTSGQPRSLAIDPINRQIYWSERSGPGVIKRASLESGMQTTLISGIADPRGIALDLENGHIYFMEYNTNSLKRIDLDGTGIQTLITSPIQRPGEVAIDGIHSKVYWVELGPNPGGTGDNDDGRIYRANLDGSNIELLLSGIHQPTDIELDVVRNRMYWTGGAQIWEADLNASSPSLVAGGIRASSIALALQIPEPSTLTILLASLVLSRRLLLRRI